MAESPSLPAIPPTLSNPPEDPTVDEAQAPLVETVSAPTPEAARSSPSTPIAGIPTALRHWDRYQMLEVLGAGGMGAVYKVRDPRLGRLVALKLVHPRLGHGPGSFGEAVIRRFQREARLQAALDHPHICKIPGGCRNGDGSV